MTSPLHRPQPILFPRVPPVTGAMVPHEIAACLRDGQLRIVADHYSTGAEILAQLKVLLGEPVQGASYQTQQAHGRACRAASLRLLAPIKDHAVALSGARPIGFLKELYPELSTFALPFVQVQELHGAWRRYTEGIPLAVLGHRVHPFYGTYVPTRVSHLELFGTWISQYKGPRGRAIDVGTGCGVLALMLCRAGFGRVLATDDNPNAIESVKRELARLASTLPIDLPIDLVTGDLLGDDPTPADLIVFNPPWIQGRVDALLDGPLLGGALHRDEHLLARFFDQAIQRLRPQGRIVLLFSNIGQLVQPDLPHPILAELDRGRLRLVQRHHRRVMASVDAAGHKRRTRERVEVWELARA
ncbi:MAG: class I SAM-dependent methyltransferase [Oligoflexia bacterium]|nr:class I SAM-dependent methyltransferase [Oligoflexia bacterium]